MRVDTAISGSSAAPLILDFDGSVLLSVGTARLDLRDCEENFRYYAGFGDMQALEKRIGQAVDSHRIFLLGSGDFHHISYLLVKRIPQELQVIVFDNHPDNMFFPSGIHCGSWVYHASKLPNVSSIAVFGIASGDTAGPDLLQNRFSVMRSGKVKYYCLRPVSKLAKLLGSTGIEDISSSRSSIADIVKEHVRNSGKPVYLSIDKDVLSRDVLRSTWDQGKMEKDELLRCIEGIAQYVVAADIAGDLSSYSYKRFLKRWIRKLDGGEQVPGDWDKERAKHGRLNREIASLLGPVLNKGTKPIVRPILREEQA